MAVKNHTPGKIRYFTYFLEFPDGDIWIDQTPFVHDLQHELKNTRFMQDPTLPAYVGTDMARKGEASWKDTNSIKHTVKIEETVRNKRWGVNRGWTRKQ